MVVPGTETDPDTRMAKTIRPEIQALRGIAALLVAVYHIWFGRVSGGVDVFFVISGFLVTHSLANRWALDGAVRPAAFLRGLYARLAPAALLVIAMTVAGCVLFLPQADWPFNINEAVSATFFVNNWHLALNAVDYLNRTSDPRPFQHFWALSVQWQFYLLWAVLFWALGRIAGSSFPRMLNATIAALFIVSFGVSVLHTAFDQPFAYFSTATRVWEFSAGALLALHRPHFRLAVPLRLGLGWAGLALIVACGTILPVSTSFPGYAAVVPVCAALLIVQFGSEPHPASVRRLLTWRPLVAFGNLSYPFYLWHWPLFALWLAYSLETRATAAEGLVILATALVLSAATRSLLQGDWSGAKWLQTGRAAAALACATLVACIAWRTEVAVAKSSQWAAPQPSIQTHPGALAIGRQVAPRPLFPGSFRVRGEFPAAYADGCNQTTTGVAVIACTYGDPQGRLTIAAIGNSHITHWLPALDLVAKEHGWKVVLITKDDCQLHVEPTRSNDEAARSCDEWNRDLPRTVRLLRPDYLFVAATRHLGEAEFLPADYLDAWRRLEPRMARIIAVRSTPRFPFDVPDCIDLYGADSPKCRAPRDVALGHMAGNPAYEVTRMGARYLDLTHYFCDERECFPAVGNIVIYRDHDHLTSSYMRTMKLPLAAALQTVIDSQSSSAPAPRA